MTERQGETGCRKRRDQILSATSRLREDSLQKLQAWPVVAHPS